MISEIDEKTLRPLLNRYPKRQQNNTWEWW